jgi:hypothetical protein
MRPLSMISLGSTEVGPDRGPLARGGETRIVVTWLRLRDYDDGGLGEASIRFLGSTECAARRFTKRTAAKTAGGLDAHNAAGRDTDLRASVVARRTRPAFIHILSTCCRGRTHTERTRS